MPRLLSSYAANKRVEDGLKKKQEQIRLDYMRATHRHLDETDKLVDDLIQIHVRTPSAFQPNQPGSANSQLRRRIQSAQQSYHHPHRQPCHPNPHHPSNLPLNPNHPQSDHSGMMMRSRSRGGLTQDGTASTDDGMSAPKKVIPLPIVQVRGNEVFYQYDNYPKGWKKIEPTYKTKVLLQRNNIVSNSLRQYEQQRSTSSANLTESNKQQIADNDNTATRRDSEATRKGSVFSRRGSEFHRRESMFSRRSSRRRSRFYDDDEDGDDRMTQIIELKPQLSPGHTPRSLDGWTLMNWCLWNKKQRKPVWTSKKYMDRKDREYQRYHMSRTRDKSALPVKPSSAHSASREARRKSSIWAEEDKSMRAKSVPLHRHGSIIEEEEEYDDQFPSIGPDRGMMRPVTSIHRTDRNLAEDSRPKTTVPRRRVALDTFIDKEHPGESLSVNDENDNNINDLVSFNEENDDFDDCDGGLYSFREIKEDVLFLRPKNVRKDSRAVSEEKNLDANQSDSLSYSVLDQPVDKKSLLERMPGLAATQISVLEVQEPDPHVRMPTEALTSSQIMNKTNITTPIMHTVTPVMPELGTDSPR